MRVQKPFSYFGGKGFLAHRIVDYLPPHHTYCEVFGGSAAVLFAKPQSPIEVYNDVNSLLNNFFRVLQDREKTMELQRLLALTPYSKEFFEEAKAKVETETDPLMKAYYFFVVARQSFCGFRSVKDAFWGYQVKAHTAGVARSVATYLSAIEKLPDYYERIITVQIEKEDWRVILEKYDDNETCFYLDPPYIPETRKSGKYDYEMSLEDHQELIERILQLKGKVLLSGYRHPIHEPLENAGWARVDFTAVCHASGRGKSTKIMGEGSGREKQSRVESLWISPTAQKRTAYTLFDNDWV